MNPYSNYKPSGIDWIGDIPSHWEVKKLKFTVTKVGSGVTPSGGAEVYQTTGIPLLRSQNIYFDGLKLDDVAYVTEDVDASMSNSRVLAGDVLLNITGGSIGRCYFLPENFGPANVNQHVCIIRPAFDKISTSFLYRLLSSSVGQTQINLLQTGANREGLNFEQLKNFNLSLPPFSEQAAIARFLDEKTAQLDTLIDRKRRLIDLLREEKTALINEAVTKGINPDVPMKESGIEWLGEVPAHWEVKKVKHITKVLRGKFTHRPRNDEKLYNGQYPFIQTGEVSKAGKYVLDYTQTLNENGYKVTAEFSKGTLLMTIAATVAEVAILGFNACMPDSIVGFYPKEDIDKEFLYYKFKAMKAVFLSTSIVNTQINLNVERIETVEVSYPNLKEQIKIVQHIEVETAKIDHTISRIEREIELMQEYRTALISEVVTGKVKVI